MPLPELSTILPTAPLIPYTKSMKETKLQPAHNGMFLVNETAANDPACQAAMASIIETLRQETARGDRIRRGIEPADQAQWGHWTISDRH